MLSRVPQLHNCFMHPPAKPDPLFIDHLLERRRQLASVIASLPGQLSEEKEGERDTASWLARTYPVLAILAPVMTTQQDTIEYPGDPMCLYSALSVAVDQVVKARSAGLIPDGQAPAQGNYIYNDLCPQWGMLPSRAYRLQASDSGIRDYAAACLTTDQTIFDPRVWNDEVKQYFTDHVLKVLQPRVILISMLSPAHRYAVDIARLVRCHLPHALVIFGGRHIDETMRFEDEGQHLTLSYSSTLRAMSDERIGPVVDFLISGDGYFALDLLMKAISLAMDIQEKTTTVQAVIQTLDRLASLAGPLPGRAVLAAVDGMDLHVFPMRGPRFDLADLPSPYQAAAIRARFSIFQEHGRVLRTAHFMVTSACPYHCDFCSEGVTVVGRMLRFSRTPVQSALARVFEYLGYGAEALFFDDSIFWGGNIKRMVDFARALAQARLEAATSEYSRYPYFKDQADIQRLVNLQWGAQLTAEFLTTIASREKMLECLALMKGAGCTYIYMGIESLASSIMDKIHKNLHRVDGPSWADKIRSALLVLREAEVRVGSSVLFGLDGETRATIDETIEGVGNFIDEGLLYLASPNILTYHPATAITRQHGKEDQLDYHSLDIPNKPPYIYFEEAFSGVVSQELSEADVWYIHRRAKERWGQIRYTDPIQITHIPSLTVNHTL